MGRGKGGWKGRGENGGGMEEGEGWLDGRMVTDRNERKGDG